MPLEAGGGLSGGGGAAAGSYRVLGQRPDILVRSGTDVVDAMTITVAELVYGVTFSFTIPRSEWAGMGTQGEASLYASWVQAIGAMDEVIGMSYTQDVNAAGLLRDAMVITVGTPDGLNSAEVTRPMATLNSGATFQAVRDAYATLTQTAAQT